MSENKGEAARDMARKEREERLAAALRANLRRRKTAGRLTQETPAEEAAKSVPGSGEAGK